MASSRRLLRAGTGGDRGRLGESARLVPFSHVFYQFLRQPSRQKPFSFRPKEARCRQAHPSAKMLRREVVRRQIEKRLLSAQSMIGFMSDVHCALWDPFMLLHPNRQANDNAFSWAMLLEIRAIYSERGK
jgi:hypothetical protein